jgi:hypothetical protein
VCAPRGVSLQGKSVQFMGSDDGGQGAASFHCSMETAELNGLDRDDHLRQVFERIAERPIHRLGELLPSSNGRPRRPR